MIPEQYREQSLQAYTEALRNVYIIGLPCALLALAGALVIKNSRMQTKEEEEEANRLAREKAAGVSGGGKDEVDEERAQKEEDLAVGTALVGAEPAAVVEQGHHPVVESEKMGSK